MLEKIALKHVGPAPEMSVEFAPRLNLITGDNGLGKTFLLDVAWWALTRSWAGERAIPDKGMASKAVIEFQTRGTAAENVTVRCPYDKMTQSWEPKLVSRAVAKAQEVQALVIYVRVDGGISVWDPLRGGAGTDLDLDTKQVRMEAFHFSPDEIWSGLESHSTVFCNGLLADWVNWQYRGKAQLYDSLVDVLQGLSPDEGEIIRPGAPRRVWINDTREIPTVELPYGTIPVVHAAAGMRRVLSLAYMLVWAWYEHCQASEVAETEPVDRVVMLFDEVESHLHPRWQRTIIQSLIAVLGRLMNQPSVQIIASTHAPLVMASVEPVFDEAADRVFNIQLAADRARVDEVPWAKQGDAVGWLVSDVFGLKQARSRDAERAIEAAEAFMRGDNDSLPDDLQTKEAIHQELRRVLAGQDPFWPRWIVEARGDRS